MKHLGSLGRFMNEGMEHHHKETWRLYDHTARGGTQGNLYIAKLEDGSGKYDKGGGKRTSTRDVDVTEAIMRRQSLQVFERYHRSWDAAVWEKGGCEKPADDADVYEYLVHKSERVKERKRETNARRNVVRQANAAAKVAKRAEEVAAGRDSP
jgi:hypothetical protein